MRASLRIIRDGARSGEENMAIDEAILESVSRNSSPPTARFYSWSRPCVSLGYFQSCASLDFTRIRALGLEIVRRPTGGRAVLHLDEITYSLTLPLPGGKAGTIRESFKVLNEGVLRGLSRLGVEVFFHALQGRAQKRSSPLCFAAPAQYEILAGGEKILGSAQVRRNGTLLQQCSLPLTVDDALTKELLGGEAPAYEDGLPRGLRGIVKSLPGKDVIIDSIIDGIRESLAMDASLGAVSDGERAMADELARSQYGLDSWTCRR
ncbi:MAG: lipoate--protein ligase family protein [Candidatus Eremiobacteraeota bacterium]|nr:lipoate--protein ligase family protein [Candidatus Eremiobacteraeota bacterium]